jgi:hypothetical protein
MLEERYWAKVDVRGDDECWPWIASTQKGYGQIKARARSRSPLKAHRLAWEFATGEAPGDMLVMHICDNTLCQNPGHLMLGAGIDNSLDAARKGRLRRKLTPVQVAKIRELRANGRSLRHIAHEFGMSVEAIRDIDRRHTWAWTP